MAPEVLAGALVGEELLVGGKDFGGLGFVFFEEFDAVAAKAGGVELGVEVGSGLGLVVEEGVATADVGFQGVVDAHAVAEGDAVFFTGATAVGEVGAGGEESGEGAVLHVKHGHVLVEGDLEPGRVGGGEEGKDLLKVEVVGEGEGFELGFAFEEGGGEVVGDVEREVAGEAEGAVFEEGEGTEVADEDAIGGGAFDELEEACFARFLDAGGGEEDFGGGAGGADFGDGVGVAADVFEVEVEAGDVEGEGGGDLGGGAAQDRERSFRRGECGCAGCGRVQARCLHYLGRRASGSLHGRDELLDEFAAEVVEGGKGEDERGFEIEGNGSEVVGGAAEASELVAEGGFVEGSFLRELEGLGGGDSGGLDLAVAEVGGRGGEGEGLVFTAGGADVELPLFADGDVAFEALAEGFVEGGVVGFEDAGTGGEEVHVELAALELDPAVLDDVEAAALFGVGVGGVFEDDAVAGFEGDGELVELDGVAGE